MNENLALWLKIHAFSTTVALILLSLIYLAMGTWSWLGFSLAFGINVGYAFYKAQQIAKEDGQTLGEAFGFERKDNG